MRDIKDNLERFISGSIPHCLIGVRFLDILDVLEISSVAARMVVGLSNY